MRAPAVLSKGFRPFFVVGALHAAVSIPLWLLVLRGRLQVDVGVAPATWHAHEMLFGFSLAIIAGFLLTAAGNWTRRETVIGAPLAGLVCVWLAGRLAFLPEVSVHPGLRAAVDLAFLPLLAFGVGRALVSTSNRRNYGFLVLLGALWLCNLLFHFEALGVAAPVDASVACRVALDLVIVAILLVGGRIIPMFTRNATGHAVVSSRVADRASLAGMAAVAALEAVGAPSAAVQFVCGLTAVAVFARAARWGASASLRAPILWVLHVGHAWVGIGLAMRALSGLGGGVWPLAATHALAVGAIGTLTLGMMVRVALGHTGRRIQAPPLMAVAFVAITIAAAVRVAGPILVPTIYLRLLDTAGGLWAACFVGYTLLFTRILTTPRPDASS